jgi:hypothetical protein
MEFKNVHSFKDRELCRAIPASEILSGWGRLLECNGPAETSYQKSKVVRQISTFISHNWSMNRWDKLAVIMVWFCIPDAIKAALIASVFLAVLTAIGVLPLWQVEEGTLLFGSWSPWCSIGSLPVFVIVFFFGRQVRQFLLWNSKMAEKEAVFFDRACIHQTDPTLRQAGIDHLAAFLAQSQEVLVVHTNLYFRKLWTMYEICDYLALKHGKGVILIPAYYPKLNLIMFVTCFCWVVAKKITILHPAMKGVHLDQISLVVLILIYLWAALRWIRTMADIDEQIKTFSVSAAQCAVESDRPIVEAKIVLLAKHKRLADRDATDQEALEAFEIYVRRHLGEVVHRTFGKNDLPWTSVLSTSFPDIICGLDLFSSGVASGRPIGTCFRLLAIDVANALLVAPLFAVCTLIALKHFKSRGRSLSLLPAMLLPVFSFAMGFLISISSGYSERVKLSEFTANLMCCIVLLLLISANAILFTEIDRCPRWFRRLIARTINTTDAVVEG